MTKIWNSTKIKLEITTANIHWQFPYKFYIQLSAIVGPLVLCPALGKQELPSPFVSSLWVHKQDSTNLKIRKVSNLWYCVRTGWQSSSVSLVHPKILVNECFNSSKKEIVSKSLKTIWQEVGEGAGNAVDDPRRKLRKGEQKEENKREMLKIVVFGYIFYGESLLWEVSEDPTTAQQHGLSRQGLWELYE